MNQITKKTQDILFLNEKEFAVCGDVVSKESALHSIMVWDFESTASISDQIFHVFINLIYKSC